MMQTCPVCGSESIPLRFRLITAFGAGTRCRRCGSSLVRSTNVIWSVYFVLIVGGAIIGGALLAFQHQAPILLVVAGVVAWAASVAIPVVPDQSDPVARNRLTRGKLRAAREDQR